MLFQVAEFVHDDVFDERFADLNELEVEDDGTLCSAASPAFLHEANFERGCLVNAHYCGAFHAFGEQFGKDLFLTCTSTQSSVI